MWWQRRNSLSDRKRMQQISAKILKLDPTWWGKVIHCKSCKELRFDHMNKCYMHNLESVLENENAQSSLRFWDTNRSLNLCQKIRPNDKNITYRIVYFAVPADHRVKIKESEKRKVYRPCQRTKKNSGTWRWREIWLNSPGDLRRLAVTYTPVKDHQLTLV